MAKKPATNDPNAEKIFTNTLKNLVIGGAFVQISFEFYFLDTNLKRGVRVIAQW